MPLRNYSLRVLGAAADVEDYRVPLRTVAEGLGSRYVKVRLDADDVLVNAVFDVPDHSLGQSATVDGLLLAAKHVLPPELHDRLVVEEAPSRPHVLSAQLLEDRRRGTAILPGALQAAEDLEAWHDFLLRAQPRGLLELGTASGAFSRWLSARVEWFTTIDVHAPDPGTPGFVQLDVWDRADDVRALISDAPRPLVLYCDNGNKPLEVETFAPALRAGDFLAVHDLGTEIFPENIPSSFIERLTFGLTGFYEKTQ